METPALANTDTAAPNALKSEVATALAALQTYNYGSSRAMLVPIDDAVRASLSDPSKRLVMESQLLTALQAKLAPVAVEYVCSKLNLLGSARAVPALVRLLTDPQCAPFARTSLETLPGSEAVAALRAHLDKLDGAAKIGVINSLGARRDARSVKGLTKLLQHSDSQIAEAAAAALGRIGTDGADDALLRGISQKKAALNHRFADACLVCAEQLLQDGKKAKAQALYRALLTNQPAKYIQAAAEQGLKRAA